MIQKRVAWSIVGISVILPLTIGYSWDGSTPLIIDHTCTDLTQIPEEWIDSVQANRRLHYVHTSHGEQLTCGLERLEGFDSKYSVAIGSQYLPTEEGAFCVYDREGDPDDYWYGDEWINGPDITRQTLSDNPTINTSMFCWCIQMEIKDSAYVEEYFDSLNMLEAEFPNVTFIYMTGNAQITGAAGYNRWLRNEQIRRYCRENNKVLFDFADLDSWWFNPSTQEWEQATYEYGGYTIPREHPNVFGNDCGHTSWENCEQKARALWWMMVKLAGWEAAVSNSEFIRGDVDGNGTIVMSDAGYIFGYLYVPGSPTPSCMDAAASNDDGTITMFDALYIMRFLYVPESPQPPVPFHSCGPSPTDDGLGCYTYPCGTAGFASVRSREKW